MRYTSLISGALALVLLSGSPAAAVPPPPIMVPVVALDGPSFVVLLLQARLGDPGAQTRIGYAYQTGTVVPKDGAAAMAWYGKASDQGYAMAGYDLGNMYANGDGVAKDEAAAAEWYRKAADRDLDVAQAELGDMYFKGVGVPQDYVQAYLWLDLATAGRNGGPDTHERNSAAARLTPAQLADAQAQAAAWQPVPMTDDQRCAGGHDAYNRNSYVEAASAFFPLAQSGNACAQFWLGEMYYFGRGETKDRDKALDWFSKAAAQGHVGAEQKAGRLLADKGDYAEAMPLWQKAADQGFAEAELDIGSSYLYGAGVTRDDATGAAWLRKAADQGWAEAQLTLGKLYHLGRGVTADDREAYVWESLAVLYGHNTSIEEDATTDLKGLYQALTPDQIAEADKRVAAWTPTIPGP